MLVMVVVYLGITAYMMVRFSGHDIPGLIIASISVMSISAYLFSLFESIKDIELKNDFKNSNTMALGIFRGVKYAFAVAFAAYAFVFQYFDFTM